jgi:hypothetical protein
MRVLKQLIDPNDRPRQPRPGRIGGDFGIGHSGQQGTRRSPAMQVLALTRAKSKNPHPMSTFHTLQGEGEITVPDA